MNEYNIREAVKWTIRVGDVRRKLKLRGGYVAKQVGVTPAYYSHIETNQVIPSLKIAMRIAKLLKCKVEDLWEREDEERPERTDQLKLPGCEE